ncbi:T-cell receptor-associated transmembrane adapter 1 isoform X1 [Pipistrellus kuhlii]|uniref:T-cell receptor-associated transmembrane adapter 1 isoform X1 n=1 Tax=Pipistrellus kuhlii TaxID=59472 RepID=UPI00174EF6F8|nr:T-cell receptor-associated transmembrane adapter 1 isoform X1 [Pipistrellus kuhlii]KAF6384016.1 T cell receptor associated transmembrane adaptor 1 [Pipistrellus kuhlii]
MSGNPECQYYVWAIIASLVLALVISLIFNVSHYVEKKRQGKIYRDSDYYISGEDECYIEDTPIYGNLDNVVPEQMDENCYEQMKARPERFVNELQEATPPALAIDESQMFYASLSHNCEGKPRKPRKQNISVSDKNEDELLHGVNTSLPETTLVYSLPPASPAIEENIHDDPVRLFGLIRANKEPVT